MRFWLLFVLATVSFALIQDHIVEFDDARLQLVLEQAKHSLIYFYSDSCKYCRDFEPSFNYLSVLYNNVTKEKDLPFQVIKINARKNAVSSRLFQIKQYPTLKLLNYETKKITHYDRKDRSLESVVEFLKDNLPEVSPNYENYQSELIPFDESNLSDTLVVFTLSTLHDWHDHYFPTHFYQRLAATYKKKHKFALVEVDKLENSDVLQKYLINSFPSIIYYTKNRFKTFRTYGNSEHDLEEHDIVDFIKNLKSKSHGTWFNSIKDLEAVEVDESKQEMRKGFNLNKGHEVVDDDPDDYKSLLDHIEL